MTYQTAFAEDVVEDGHSKGLEVSESDEDELDQFHCMNTSWLRCRCSEARTQGLWRPRSLVYLFAALVAVALLLTLWKPFHAHTMSSHRPADGGGLADSRRSKVNSFDGQPGNFSKSAAGLNNDIEGMHLEANPREVDSDGSHCTSQWFTPQEGRPCCLPNQATLGEWTENSPPYEICIAGVTPPWGHSRPGVANSTSHGATGTFPSDTNVRKEMPYIFTVETRIDKSIYEMPGVPGVQYVNLGAGQEWRGFRTKPELFQLRLKDVARDEPSRYVVLADGGDFGFGGCSEDELFAIYHKIVNASLGAGVVAGGDPWLYPWTETGGTYYKTMNYGHLDGRMSSVFHAFGRSHSSNPYPFETRFINSGFIMGPASAVLKVVECQLSVDMSEQNKYDDQLALRKCMFAYPSLITIDYSGLLVLRAKWDMQNNFWPLAKANGRIVNLAYGTPKPQCFMHFPSGTDTVLPNAVGHFGFAETCGPIWMKTYPKCPSHYCCASACCATGFKCCDTACCLA